MNLTRMRQLNFDQLALEAYEKYKGPGLIYLDQDILNIVFGTHRGKLIAIAEFRSNY